MKQGDLFSDVEFEEERHAEPSPSVELERPAPALPAANPVANEEDRPVDRNVERAPSPRPAAPPVSDARARRVAVTGFDRPLLLAAGAGTGKTATLVARVLHWGLGPGWDEAATDEAEEPEGIAVRVLRGIAAITFTEAAAAEMSARVGQALARIQRATAGGRVDVEELPLGLVPEALPAAADVLHLRARSLRAALDHLNVGTIHAFCRRLLAAHPLAVGMDPAFEVDATFSETELVVREVIERDLERHWQDPVDPNLIVLARHDVSPPKIEAALVALVEAGAHAADFADDPLDEATCAGLLGAVREHVEPLWQLAAPIRTGAESTVRVVTGLEDTRTLFASLSASPRAAVEESTRRLAEIWYRDRRSWNRFKEWGKGRLLAGETKRLGDAAEALVAHARELRPALETLLELDVEHLEAARTVTLRLLRGVEAELRRRGVATFGDLLDEARRLLLEHPEVAAAERRRLRQLLVDEFQDTDQVQCDVVEALALSGPADERPSLFLVGDPKQSIFAWRNADLAAFDAFATKVVAAGGERLELVANFRSRRTVLEEVARVVAPVMEEVPGVQPPFVALEAAHPDADRAGDGPDLEFWVSWPTDPATGLVSPDVNRRLGASYEVEAQALAHDLARRHAAGQGGWQDFAVVFRGMTNIEPYLQAMRELGVPYEVQTERTYFKRREVIDVTALAVCVLDPTDALALVTLLRSPMVGVPDAAFPFLWEEGFPAAVARLRDPDSEELDGLEQTVRAAAGRLPQGLPGLAEIAGWEDSLFLALRALARARASFDRDPSDRFLEVLTDLFLPDAVCAARFLGAYRLANVERFFRDLLRTLEERAGDVTAVVRTLRANLGRQDRTEASRPSDSGQDAVRVLTIHGAKGLEFRHVYLAQTHRKENVGEDATAFDRRGDLVAYKLLGATSPTWFEAARRRKESEAAERVRLLYVALTRARERLVVMGAFPEGGERKPWGEAQQTIKLLEHRPHVADVVEELAKRAGSGDATPVVDPSGARWCLAVHLVGAATGRVQAEERETEHEGLPSPAAIEREARRLAERRTAAVARAARPFHAASSAEAHVEAAEWHAARRFAEAATGEIATDGAGVVPSSDDAGREPVGRAAAQAAGTAVHRVLEELDLADEPEAAATAGAERLQELLRDRVPADELEATVARAGDLLRRAAANGMLARLMELAPRIVARELPVLEPPGEDGAEAPVGFVSGAMDLVYRDPGTDALVIADFKTDPVEGEELEERARGYAPQGRAYVRALRGALALDEDPRFELWFLHAGRVVAP